MRRIRVGKNAWATVDDNDYDFLAQFRWWPTSRGGYAYTWMNGRNQRMHRVIMQLPSYLQVDHINGRTRDNRRSNLRAATSSQNHMNRRSVGVTWDKVRKLWEAQIKVNYKKIHLGRYRTRGEARKARIEAEGKYFGVFSKNYEAYCKGSAF